MLVDSLFVRKQDIHKSFSRSSGSLVLDKSRRIRFDLDRILFAFDFHLDVRQTDCDRRISIYLRVLDCCLSSSTRGRANQVRA